MTTTTTTTTRGYATRAVADERTTWRPDVGDVVRVTLPYDRVCASCPHFGGETGRTGRVVKVRAPLGAPSHAYLVVLNAVEESEAILDRRLAILARHYAADELERIA